MNKNILFSAITLTLVLMFSLDGCRKKPVPVIETNPVSQVGGTSAVCGGNITDDGGETVISHGVCWSTNLKPTILDNFTNDGAGAGSFISNLSHLAPATTYYVRAYAANSAGYGYGMAMSFKTLGEIPEDSTETATDITTTSVILSAIVNPNHLLTTVFFEYGTTTSYGNSLGATQSPIDHNYVTSVSRSISELLPGTTYHYRVKAENSLGSIYGVDKTFTTLGQQPMANTQAATSITVSGVVFNSLVNPNYLTTTVTFEYGISDMYGSVRTLINTFTGSSVIQVSAALQNLQANTTYHYRVVAQNSLGTTYGSDMTFTTLGQGPVAATLQATNLLATSATLNGSVNPNLLSTTVTFEYGSSISYGSTINATQNILTGSTSMNVNAFVPGLTTGITYHFRVKAVNSLGTAYGLDMTFILSEPTPVTDTEGNVYSVVQLGTQVWMAENLKTTKLNDNSDIPLVTDNSTWTTLTTPGYCWYNNDESTYKSLYGALYNWYAVNTGKLCPSGWHVPSDAEFTTLTSFLGGVDIAGGKMKVAGTDYWSSPNTGATNESGFTGLPAGQRDESGTFIGIGLYGLWWTSTLDSSKPWYRNLFYTVQSVYVSSGSLGIRGFSIRCLKN